MLIRLMLLRICMLQRLGTHGAVHLHNPACTTPVSKPSLLARLPGALEQATRPSQQLAVSVYGLCRPCGCCHGILQLVMPAYPLLNLACCRGLCSAFQTTGPRPQAVAAIRIRQYSAVCRLGRTSVDAFPGKCSQPINSTRSPL